MCSHIISIIKSIRDSKESMNSTSKEIASCFHFFPSTRLNRFQTCIYPFYLLSLLFLNSSIFFLSFLFLPSSPLTFLSFTSSFLLSSSFPYPHFLLPSTHLPSSPLTPLLHSFLIVADIKQYGVNGTGAHLFESFNSSIFWPTLSRTGIWLSTPLSSCPVL
jgi:hypothetical protein